MDFVKFLHVLNSPHQVHSSKNISGSEELYMITRFTFIHFDTVAPIIDHNRVSQHRSTALQAPFPAMPTPEASFTRLNMPFPHMLHHDAKLS